MRNLERSCRFKRVLKKLIFFAVTISVGSAFQIFIVRTEKKFRWVLFLIIGIESLKGWPHKFVEVENVKKLLRVMMMLLWIML